jgi:hypothetical protein
MEAPCMKGAPHLLHVLPHHPPPPPRTIECEEARKKLRQLTEERKRSEASVKALQSQVEARTHELEKTRNKVRPNPCPEPFVRF